MMQYTDTEAALIGGLISTYFFQPAVSASLKDAYSRVLEHLQQNALTSSDLSADSKGCEFSDAHVPSEPAATAGAYGNQYADDRAPEWLPITADCIL